MLIYTIFLIRNLLYLAICIQIVFPLILVQTIWVRLITSNHPIKTFKAHFGAQLTKSVTTYFPFSFVRFAESLKRPWGFDPKLIKDEDGFGYWIGSRKEKASKTIVYIHGGGFTIGYSTFQIEALAYLCKRLHNVNILSIDYPLAPEHPFPAALDYLTNVYRTLAKRGVSNIILMGDSGGGTLALTTLFNLVEIESRSIPIAVIGISPGVDIKVGKELRLSNDDHDLISGPFIHSCLSNYLQNNSSNNHLISPVSASDYFLKKVFSIGKRRKTPVKLLITLGGLEIIRDSIRDFAHRLKSLGVRELELVENPDMLHIYPLMPLLFGEDAYEGLDRIISFVNGL